MELSLRRWRPEDGEGLIRLCDQVDRTYLSGQLPNPCTKAVAKRWITATEIWEKRKGKQRAIIADGAIVGNITLEKGNDVWQKNAELGYYLLPQCEGKGIMTWAVNEMCRLAFDEMDILRITALVCERNQASRRVLEKNGFKQEGLLKNAMVKDEQPYDLCIYGRLKN